MLDLKRPFGRAYAASRGTATPRVLLAGGAVGAVFLPGVSTCTNDSAGTPAAYSDAVYGVRDLWGQGFPMVQADPVRRPILGADAGGMPYLEFDGLGDVLVTQSAIDLSGVSAAALIVAVERLSGLSARFAASHGNNADGAIRLSSEGTSWVASTREGAADVSAAAADADLPSKVVLTALVDRAAGRVILRRNGVVAATDTTPLTGAMANAPFALGALSTAANGFACRIFGAALVGALPGDPALAIAERYLARRVGVSLP